MVNATIPSVLKTVTKTYLLVHSIKNPAVARVFFVLLAGLCVFHGITETEVASFGVFIARQFFDIFDLQVINV